MLGRRAAAFNQKARRLGVRGVVTAEQLGVIAMRDHHCVYCGIGLDAAGGSYDHVVSFDKGGENSWTNIVRCCYQCQRDKFTKSPAELHEFRATRFVCDVCGNEFRPRYGDWKRGQGKVCSRRCAGKRRWVHA